LNSGKRIKHFALCSDIPILLCTGYSETVTEAKASEIGIKGMLTQPVSMADMALAVRGAPGLFFYLIPFLFKSDEK